MPKREVDFEPSIYDSETGLPVSEFVSPSTSLMTYENKNSSSSISYIIKPADIHIYFRENKDAGEGTSLSILSMTHLGMLLTRAVLMRLHGIICFRQVF